ncbi:MAG: AarF/UbiB family protein [Phycisphaerales bacterium]|jgi:ubiquinone biosynthesis protein|nr:AarF/UbiB family protein [Phycisphaerales bacterium]MDP6310550.1 AarF/UbiB family protein [Phycisphaerales bacterium]MDP7087401.1 AarF/UbiB family protein [Phycisphaerales bacterium]MDP7188530.1 AarF/UbiB family protein [Phycisphaerales bacterium]MDP7519670.1 AarF/UbiB family protein [Phycisphaerales bacterium]|tara:strand:- start:1189 stop:2880 length:1692 start_codon:yes stop_codon:yes gene_type:complete
MSVLQLVRHANRYREILSILVKFGFREFFEDAKLDLLLEKGQRLFSRGAAAETETASRPERLRMALEELGPTFIKLGQILSTRPDILPPDYITELQKLQAEVPPVPWSKIKPQLEDDLGDLHELFESLDEEPMAAASMAQAHRAVLREGSQPVVLKVLRPGIERVIRADVEILEAVADWVARHSEDLPFDPVSVVEEFSEAIGYELDFVHEGRNTDLFRSNLEEGEQAWFPEVYWQITRRRVLGLEEIKGVQLTNWRSAGLSDQQREMLVRNGAYTILRQVLDVGFFHADPHPGNLFLMDDGRLCFIDCGMAGRVDRETVTDLANLIHGIASSDIDKFYEAFLALGQVDEDQVDPRSLRRDLHDFLDQFTGVSFERLDMASMLRAFTDGLRKHRLQCPADIVLMIKALTTIEGVAEEIDPEFDLLGFARPHVEKLVKQQYSFKVIKGRFKRNAGKWLTLSERMPGRLTTILDRLGGNKFKIGLDVDGFQTLERTVFHSSRQLSYSILVAAMIMASSVLVLASSAGKTSALGWIGFIGFLVSFIFAFLILLENLWTKLRRKKDR